MSLMDKILEPTKDYISFRDLLFRLSSLNSEPLHVVVTYLLHHELDGLTFYNIDADYKIIRFAPYEFDTVKEFLKEIQSTLSFSNEEWVWKVPASLNELSDQEKRDLTKTIFKAMHCFFKKSDLLSFEPLNEILHFDGHNIEAKEKIDQPNNSLASYMTEYTLPQVAALILHIDLADITTNSSNSYIHENGRYDESTYSKFNNLVQSYSIAALNNKLDGTDVFTRTTQSFLGSPDTQIDLEKTTISRGKLASYLDSIGYQLDDLIAKQDPVHTHYSQYADYQQDESELILSLQQQVAELQARLDEKDKAFKAQSEKLNAALEKAKQAGKSTSQLSEHEEMSYQLITSILIQMMTNERGIHNKKPFPSEAEIIREIEAIDLYGYKKGTLAKRFQGAREKLENELRKKTPPRTLDIFQQKSTLKKLG